MPPWIMFKGGTLPDGFNTGSTASIEPDSINPTGAPTPEPATMGILAGGLGVIARSAARERVLEGPKPRPPERTAAAARALPLCRSRR